MARIRSYGPSMVLGVFSLAVLLGGPTVVRQLAWAEQDAGIQQSRQALANNPLGQLSQSFHEVAQSVEPSVVHISVSREAGENPQGLRGRGNLPDNLPEDLLERLFPDRFRDRPNRPDRPEGDRDEQQGYEEYNVPRQYGSGSGWVYQHENGQNYIITNNHVVENADSIRVKFFDKSTRQATVVGADPQTDIAVLKVDDGDLHPAKLADAGVAQGEIVFAFGSPFQFEFSMSQGIVSGEGRRLGILGSMGYENFIQTDAAINPGNSGGPLTNIRGEVIGMNTAIASRTGSYNGLGFAIPVKMIVNVADQIIETGGVQRGYLGVWIKDDPRLLRSYGYEGRGVLVEDFVGPQSPAKQAGLQRNDIIVAINGNEVRDAGELRRAIAGIQPGETAALTVVRDGQKQTIDVELGKLPEEVASASRGGGGSGGPEGEQDIPAKQLEPLRQLGLAEVSTLDERAAQRLDVELTPGVLVREVRPGSVAFSEGLRPGAIITHIQGQRVQDLGELTEQIGKLDLRQGVRLRVQLDGISRLVFLELR